MANTSFKNSPLTPMFGINESFFQGSPFNSSSDSSFGIEWRKKGNNLNNTSRTFSPGRFVKSPNISPITKKISNLTIAEEPDEDKNNKTFVVSPHTPVNNVTFVINQDNFYKKPATEKEMMIERERRHKRRTMFLLPPTPTSSFKEKLNQSDFEHKFTVDTILKEIGMTKYINLFEAEEINIPAFLTLNDCDLMTIGISDPDERKEIIKAVETYQFLK